MRGLVVLVMVVLLVGCAPETAVPAEDTGGGSVTGGDGSTTFPPADDDEGTTVEPGDDDGEPACSGVAPTCWPVGDELCEGPNQPGQCVDGQWECPRGTTTECGHGDDACVSDPDVTCVDFSGGYCSDLILPADCDRRGWFCPGNSIDIDDCPEGTTEDSGSDSGSGSESGSGSGSSTG